MAGGTGGVPRSGVFAVAVGAMMMAAPSESPSATTDPQWRITSFQETLTVQNDGLVHVSQQITFDFGSAPGHGIVEYLDPGQRYKDGPDPDLSGISVKSSDAPADISVKPMPGSTTITVGNPARTVTDAHTYDIEFTVAHAAYADSDHPGTASLLWPAVMMNWDVPILDADVTVKMPGAVSAEQCWQGGHDGSDSCDAATAEGASAHFTQTDLAADQQLVVKATSAIGNVTKLPSASALQWPPKSTDVAGINNSKFPTWLLAAWGAMALLIIMGIAGGFGRRRRGGGTGDGGGWWSGGSDGGGFSGGGDMGGGGGDSGGGGHSGGW